MNTAFGRIKGEPLRKLGGGSPYIWAPTNKHQEKIYENQLVLTSLRK
jgi:hypothetical protein